MLRRHVEVLTARSQLRRMHASSMQETMQPVPGMSAGQLSTNSDVTGAGGELEEERRRPILRQEVAPRKKEWNALATYYRWGYDSLSLFKTINEDAGQWYLANSTAIASTYTMIGDFVAAGMWSGVWKYTFGLSELNLRPDSLYRRAFGRRDKNGAVHINYEEDAASKSQETQLFTVPHTKEHQMHQRLRNPPLPKYSDIDAVHYKRILRESQYHLGQGLRFYLIDGVFGNHNGTGTPYRIFTDNADHAYFASISALRKFNYVPQDELPLVKRLGAGPLDDWAWRRPGVVIYHCPGFEFERPRIVEEFGGPRPSDLGLKHRKFQVVDPYAIPMKAVMGGVLACGDLQKTIALLSARWGFYADDRKLVTLGGDSVLSKDGQSLTVVVGPGQEAIRTSDLLYSSGHVRVADGVVSRCWDSVSLPASVPTRSRDLVEDSTSAVHRPLPTRMGADSSVAVSHRLFGRRKLNQFGSKRPHNYTNDPAERAALGGHLFNASVAQRSQVRPAAMTIAGTNFVVLGAPAGKLTPEAAAKSIVSGIAADGWLYAEEDKLVEAVAATLATAKSIVGLPADKAKDTINKLAKEGSL